MLNLLFATLTLLTFFSHLQCPSHAKFASRTNETHSHQPHHVNRNYNTGNGNGNGNSSPNSAAATQHHPAPSENFIHCHFNPLCFCKYDQKTEVYDSLQRLWQLVAYEPAIYLKSVAGLLNDMRDDQITTYFMSEGDVTSLAHLIVNSSKSYSSLSIYSLVEPGPIFDIDCSDVPLALVPTEYNAHSVISHVSVTGSKLNMLDGSAFAGLEIHMIRLAKDELYFVSEYAFSSLSNSLNMLDLSSNYLDEIPLSALKSLKLLEWLNLSNNLLNSVSGEWFTMANTLRKLLLSSNSIDYLPGKLFSSFNRLSWLDLSGNFIRNVTLDNLPPNLQTLNLKDNRFSEFPTNVFHLKSLSWLFLGGCSIERIPTRWPTTLQPLQMNQMDLAENFIQIWPNKPFGTQLTVLDLSLNKNYIQKLPSAAFYNMNIFRISLGYNRISSIDPLAFQTLEGSLKYLNLENNRLEYVPWKSLSNLATLMHLYLGSNFLADEIGAPESAECKLTYLGLNGNQLTRIPRRVLSRCLHLFHLNLGYNQIENLDDFAHFFARGKKLRNLSTLILRNNPIRSLAYSASNSISQFLEETEDWAALTIPTNKSVNLNTNTHSTTNSGVSSNKYKTRPVDKDKNEINPENIAGSGSSWADQQSDSDSNSGGSDSDSDQVVISHVQNEEPLPSITSGNRVLETGNIFRTEVFPNLRELSLSFCQLSGELQPFPAIPLTTLEISAGLKSATTLSSTIFHSLRNLEWLALDHNSLQTLSEYTFYSNRKLVYVNLEWNRITSLPPVLFHPDIHKSITHLRLSHNRVEILRPDSFLSFPAINLDLSYNNIGTIEKNAFATSSSYNSRKSSSSSTTQGSIDHNIGVSKTSSNFDQMYQTPSSTQGPRVNRAQTHHHFDSSVLGLNLYLRNNRIWSVRSGALSQEKFAIVDLTWNRLSYFHMDAFGPETIVGGLNLSHNAIERFTRGTWRPLFMLKFLDLSNNLISNKGLELRNGICVVGLLDISNNKLDRIEQKLFPANCSLKELNLARNHITTLDSESFSHLRDLTVLNLSGNQISLLPPIIFIRNNKLRAADLSRNKLRTLPRDSLVGTSIEILDLSWNQFVNLPVGALSQISRRLKRLDISHNSLEHLDSTMFEGISGILALNLSNNRLSLLPDNTFANLGSLRELDLSFNFLRANFKELFHFLPKLKLLRLSGCGIKVLPPLPLPHLITLDLASNGLLEIRLQSLASLTRLRHLDLRSNELTGGNLPNWTPLYNLITLKMSNNPLRSFTKDTFYGLGRLEHLEISNMDRLDRFDSDVLSHLTNLKTLSVETYPNIEKYRFRLGAILSNLPYLEELQVKIKEATLSDQLLGGILPKLRKLQITGSNLKRIEPHSMDGLQNCHKIELAIRGTGLEELPPQRIFELLASAAWSRLDLTNNRINSFDSLLMYPNRTLWFTKGTKILEGGLVLDGNEWVCDCDLVWVGEWLRRWLRESFQSHSTDNIPLIHSMYEEIRRPTCRDGKGRRIPLIDLYTDEMCHASALSTGTTSKLILNYKIIPYMLIYSTFLLLSVSTTTTIYT